jgi:hypothetical protein
MNNRHLYILCAILVAIGALMTGYRLLVLGFPALPDQTSETWRIEARVAFDAQDKSVKAQIPTLLSEGPYAVVSESFVAPGFGLTTAKPTLNRIATFTVSRANGPEALYYSAVVHRILDRTAAASDDNPPLQRSGFSGARAAASEAIVRRLESQAAGSESFVQLLMRELAAPPAGREAAALLGPTPNSRRVADIAVRVLGDANIPARAVHGLRLDPDRRDARFSHWIEFWRDGTWVPFDPDSGALKVPDNHLPWWRGNNGFLTVDGAADAEVAVAVRRVYAFTLRTALERANAVKEKLVEFSLFGLPLQTQEVFRILLVVPLGILFLVVLRNVIGIKTFGTFMPVLIALAFRETQLVGGVIMFSFVVGVGLLVRLYLEQLKLLLVPRLAAVVMVVIIIMAAVSIVSHKFGFDRGLSVALFPIVILSMTIERMTVVWDERGPREAMQQGFGSLAVAVACYLVMNITAVQHFLFVFPESLFIVLAFCLLLGRYSGYRLVELKRFKVLAGNG